MEMPRARLAFKFQWCLITRESTISPNEFKIQIGLIKPCAYVQGFSFAKKYNRYRYMDKLEFEDFEVNASDDDQGHVDDVRNSEEQAVKFSNMIAELAEEEDHHPKIIAPMNV